LEKKKKRWSVRGGAKDATKKGASFPILEGLPEPKKQGKNLLRFEGKSREEIGTFCDDHSILVHLDHVLGGWGEEGIAMSFSRPGRRRH